MFKQARLQILNFIWPIKHPSRHQAETQKHAICGAHCCAALMQNTITVICRKYFRCKNHAKRKQNFLLSATSFGKANEILHLSEFYNREKSAVVAFFIQRFKKGCKFQVCHKNLLLHKTKLFSNFRNCKVLHFKFQLKF